MLLALALSLASPAAAHDAAAYDVVQWQDDGCWVNWREWDPTGRETQYVSAWVDYTIPNWSYAKDTGIVWTVDGWETASWADAWYEGTEPDGRERWGVDIQPAQAFLMNPQVPGGDIVFEYAIYYDVGGSSFWDNNGGANYTIALSPACDLGR